MHPIRDDENRYRYIGVFMIKKIVLASMLLAPVYASAAVDQGFIDKMVSNTWGYMAISLTSGTPQADSENSTCLYGNSWSGFQINENNKAMSSMIMLAKAAGKKVQIITSGCENNWHKINQFYILD